MLPTKQIALFGIQLSVAHLFIYLFFAPPPQHNERTPVSSQPGLSLGKDGKKCYSPLLLSDQNQMGYCARRLITLVKKPP